MKFLIFILPIFLAYAAEDSFITQLEYGKSLYINPRGIGCIKCHGANGDEVIISTYKNKGKIRKLIAKRINNLELKDFKPALQKDRGVMPKYYLNEDEILAIYAYLQSRNTQK